MRFHYLLLQLLIKLARLKLLELLQIECVDTPKLYLSAVLVNQCGLDLIGADHRVLRQHETQLHHVWLLLRVCEQLTQASLQ